MDMEMLLTEFDGGFQQNWEMVVLVKVGGP
jgi:hypothetical protein